MEPLSSDEARQRFRTVLSGKHVSRRKLSVAKAKTQLRAVDAELDIAPILGYAVQGKWRPAILSVVVWLNTDSGRAFIAPLMLKLLPLALSLLGIFKSRRRAKTTPSTAATPTVEGNAAS